MNRILVRTTVLTAALAFAACGETTDLVLDELNEAEASELAGAVVASAFDASGDAPTPPANGPQAVPFEFSTEVSGEIECLLGGMIAFDAALDVVGDTESEAGFIEYSMTQVHDGCVAQSEGGTQFTLWGAPDLSLEFGVENNGQGVVEWGGSVMGGLEWVTDGRTGTCEVSMEFSGRQEGEASITGGLGGTICGFEVEQSFTLGSAS